MTRATHATLIYFNTAFFTYSLQSSQLDLSSIDYFQLHGTWKEKKNRSQTKHVSGQHKKTRSDSPFKFSTRLHWIYKQRVFWTAPRYWNIALRGSPTDKIAGPKRYVHWRNLEPSTHELRWKDLGGMRSGEIFKEGWWLWGGGGGLRRLVCLFYFFFYFLSRYWAKCPWAEEPHKSPSPLIWSQRGQTTTHGSNTHVATQTETVKCDKFQQTEIGQMPSNVALTSKVRTWDTLKSPSSVNHFPGLGLSL